VAHEVRCWRSRAAAIPDAALREDALHSLACKRGNTDGAALFWALPRRRDPRLLRLLAGYEVMADFLDSANERAADAGTINGHRLQRALLDALDPAAPRTDYYRHHPWREDGGYLHSLVQACQAGCGTLPAYTRVRAPMLRAATLAGVQAVNHEPDPRRREAALRAWVRHRLPDDGESSWFETTAAASAWITVLALLAAAAKPECDGREGEDIAAAYFWISLTATMLDSYADMAEDLANDSHSYIAHYPTEKIAVERVRELVRRSTREARALRDGHRHAVITACMVALYLSKDSALAPPRRAETRTLIQAGGPLAGLLLPLLRAWRAAYALRSA
jgi:tetraprenyl-beta-curcumene synthase